MNITFPPEFRLKQFAATLLLAVNATIGLPSTVIAQRNDPPTIGDIIEYEFQQDRGYGLVLKFHGRSAIVVETKDRRGEFQEKTLIASSPSFKWKVVDGINSTQAMAERTWRSSDGNFEVTAKMIGVEGAEVQLQKPDGSTMNVPTGKLSSDDRAFVRKYKDSIVSAGSELSDEIIELKQRREELLNKAGRHERLAKLNPKLVVGDIIEYEDFFDGQTYAIVSSVSDFGQVERVKGGELESESLSGIREWRFYDREFSAEPLDERTWNSASGAFSVKATLIAVNAGKVEIEKSDGATINVDLSQLSEVDQNYVRRVKGKLETKNDPQLAGDRINYGQDLRLLLDRRDELLERESANVIASKAAAKMKVISLNTRSIELPTERLKPYTIDNQSQSAVVKLKIAENADVESICFARDANVVAITAFSPFEGLPSLGVINLDTSESVTNIDSDRVGQDGKVVAISPSAETLIIYSGEGFNHELELWKHTNGQLLKKSAITYKSFSEPHAHLFSDTEGVIQSSDGDLVFFNVGERILPTHHIPAGRMGKRNSSFEVTNDDQSVVYFDPAGPGISIIDVATKKSVGGVMFEKSSDGINQSKARLNADGRTVMFSEPKRFSIYDLQTGKQVANHKLDETSLSFGGFSERINVLSDQLILIGGTSIFDLRLGLEVGSVESAFGMESKHFGNAVRLQGDIENERGSGRGGFGSVIGGGFRDPKSMMDDKTKYRDAQATISIERLPILDIVNFAKSLSEDDIVKFDSGKTVQLVFDIQNNQQLENRIRAKVTEIMEENDIEVVGQSDFVMEFAYRVGKPQTETYRIIGGPNSGTRTVNFTPKTCSATLKFNGNKIWSRGASASLGRPFSVEDLDRNIANGNNLTPDLLLKFDYPNKIYVLDPRKKREFRWQ